MGSIALFPGHRPAFQYGISFACGRAWGQGYMGSQEAVKLVTDEQLLAWDCLLVSHPMLLGSLRH